MATKGLELWRERSKINVVNLESKRVCVGDVCESHIPVACLSTISGFRLLYDMLAVKCRNAVYRDAGATRAQNE